VITLADGAELVLAVSDEIDRNRRSYPAGIPADEQVQTDWRKIGVERDQVVERAVRWIDGSIAGARF